MPTALATVLATPELLEAVLLQLPISDLLVTAQLINHHFHTAILSSCSLQEALFFRPRSRLRTSSCVPNSLLRKKFPPFFDPCADGEHSSFGRFFASETQFEDLEWNRGPEKRKAYARKEASWRRMLVAQPPRTSMRVFETIVGQAGESNRVGRLEIEKGLRMGTLYDLAQAAVAVPLTAFAVLWGVDLSEQAPGDYGTETVGRERGGRDPKDMQRSEVIITLDLHNVQQCCVDEIELRSEFRSEGYEDVKVNFGEWDCGDYN